MIADYRLPAAIVRPGTFFGPGDRLHFGRMADRLRTGKGVVIGAGNNALPFVYVTDVVQGLLLALDRERAAGQAYNITTDRPLTQGQLLAAIAREIGARPPRVHVPYHALYAGAFAAERVSAVARRQGQPVVTRLGVKVFGTDNRHAIDKARDELGFTPRMPVEDGVRLAARWYLAGSGALRSELAQPVAELLVEPDVATPAQNQAVVRVGVAGGDLDELEGVSPRVE
jgi:nucleoside-diphosphate-sugar epimerase